MLVNGVLLVPSYSDVDRPLEKKAMDVYRKLLPEWKIVPICADAQVDKKGLFHCLMRGVLHYMPPGKLSGWRYDPSVDPDAHNGAAGGGWIRRG